MTVFKFYVSENHSWWKVPNPVTINCKNNKNKASINQQPGVILRKGLELRSEWGWIKGPWGHVLKYLLSRIHRAIYWNCQGKMSEKVLNLNWSFDFKNKQELNERGVPPRHYYHTNTCTGFILNVLLMLSKEFIYLTSYRTVPQSFTHLSALSTKSPSASLNSL